MNISASSLEKKHFPVMLDEVVQICNLSKKDQEDDFEIPAFLRRQKF